MIFAEGGTSNGTGIVSFKKGAFFAEKTVRPIFIKYGYHTLNPAFDTIEFLPLAIMTLSWGLFTFEVTVLPDFTPNEFLFEQHAEKGQERWEIYAWAVRDIIIKAGKFEECRQQMRHKIIYENYMRMLPNAPNPVNVMKETSYLSTNQNLLKQNN